MSHLEHIFVSINGSWTDKISPPVILPISLVKVEEHITLFWDEKGRQRDSYWDWNIKGSMSSAGTDSYGLQEPLQNSSLYWVEVGTSCLFLQIILGFYQERDLRNTFEGELESTRTLLLSRYLDFFCMFWLCCTICVHTCLCKGGKQQFSFSKPDLKILLKPPLS